jgi:hypothetical protein
MSRRSLPVELPTVLQFRDYHEIANTARMLNQFVCCNSIKIQYEELCCYNQRYVGIFFLTKDEEYETVKKAWIETK